MAVLAMVGVLHACASEQANDPGIPFPSLEAAEELRIDGYGHDLLPIRHVLVGPAGEILIAQDQEVDVRVFTSDGGDVTTLGGRGNGPGEFQVIYSLGFLGDTLWVFDSAPGRISYYSSDYELRRTESFGGLQSGARLRTGSASIDFRSALVHELLPDGRRHVRLSSPTVPDDVDFDPTPITYANIGPDGDVKALVARYTEGDMRISVRGDGWSLSSTVPFAVVPHYDVGPGGLRSGLVEVPVEGEYVGTMQVTIWDMDGDTVYARRYPVEMESIPASVSDSALDAATERFNEVIAGQNAGDAFRRQARTPPFYPPVEDFVVGRDGSAWIRLRSPADSASTYRVLDATGEPYGVVAFSEDVRVEVADLATAWGVVQDEFDVESVVRYAIEER